MTRGAGSGHPPSAAVVAVGNELLLGQTMDTNGSWLARELSFLGLEVSLRWVVGDRPDEIRNVVGSALDQAEVVLVTGGLGPTPDDCTRESVSALLGVSLVMDSGLLENLEARSRARGYEKLPAETRVMAMVPEKGHFLANPLGAAPGLVFPNGNRGLCILLPGVPREMRGIFKAGVEPLLKEKYAHRLAEVVHSVIHTAGIPESVLMNRIEEVLPADLRGVSLAYLPDQLGVRLRLTARAAVDVAEARSRIQQIEGLLDPVLSPYRYEAESGDLAEAVGTALLRQGHTLGVAESCTGGLVSKRMTDLPGSSRFFRGGVVAYANELKSWLLGLDPEVIEANGVVSETVAEAMAVSAARELGASVGLGITGIAGPDGGSPEKPVGTVCFAVCIGQETVVRTEVFLGDRQGVRERASHAVLDLLYRLMTRIEG